jgi:hypothetical protein
VQTVQPQHPAVVLRSHFTALRVLLAVALVAIVALAATVVVLADDDASGDHAVPARSAPVQLAPSPAAGADTLSSQSPVASDTRYDGGPNEGTRGVGLLGR